MRSIGKALAWTVLTPVAALVAGISGCEVRKAYYDWQIRTMCEKDGGTTVTERAVLTRSEYEKLLNRHGQLAIPERKAAKTGSVLWHIYKDDYYREIYPVVRRSELSVVRSADNKVLGTQVSYSRVGGDFFAFHPSVFSCPTSKPNLFDLVVQQSKE